MPPAHGVGEGAQEYEGRKPVLVGGGVHNEQIWRKEFSVLNLLEWIVLTAAVLGSWSWGTSSSVAAKPASNSIGRQ